MRAFLPWPLTGLGRRAESTRFLTSYHILQLPAHAAADKGEKQSESRPFTRDSPPLQPTFGMADRAAPASGGAASSPRSTSSSSDREMQPAEGPGGQRLPQELIHRILPLACGPPVIPRTTIVGRTDSCTATLLQLSLVSKQLYSFATARLYAHVRLTTPSSLRAFHRTLTSRAALGRLVKSLHVGADRPLPSDWWPINSSTDGELECFKFELNLDCPNNSTARASVPPPQYDYNMRIGSTPTDAASQALRAAFISASRNLDVDPNHSTLDASGYDIGSSVWHVRVVELQAALELYGLEMQRRCGAGAACPSMRVGTVTPAQDCGVFTVTRAQIYRRLMRAGAPTDSFDHPLLHARSGLPWSAEARDDAEHTSPNRTINDGEDPSDTFSLPATSARADDPDNAEVIVFPSDLTDPVDLAIPTGATVAGNISLARSVMALTPLLRSLALTGCLESAILGDRFACALQDLRILTTGPTPRMWSAWPLYDNPTLITVEKLNVLDQLVGLDEIDQLFGDKSSLISLRHLHWTFLRRFDEAEPEQ